MNRAALLILVVLLVGGAGAFVVLNGDDGMVVTDLENESWLADEPELSKPVELAVGPAKDPQAEKADDETLAGLAALFREEVEGEQGEVRVLVVQVWNGKRGVPASETDVFFLDGFDGPELKDPYAQHWSSMAEKNGEKYRTDVQGRVELPGVQDWAIVTAQRSGAYGFAKVGRKHRKVETIMLRPDETVTVRVVASGGDGEDRAVAGVPVGIVQQVPTRPNPRWETLMDKMKELEMRAAEVERIMRNNPAMRERAAPRMQQIRQQQGQLKREMGRIKAGSRGDAGRGKGRGKGRGRDRGRRGKKELARGKAAAKKRAKKSLPITMRPHIRAQRQTDASGIAVFRHFQLYRLERESWWSRQHESQFEAVLLMPLQKAETLAFAGQPVPTKTLELRLPPTGSLALRTVDRDGRPFTHPVHGDLHMKTDNPVPWARLRKRKEQNEAEIVFPFVGLGLEFEASCRLDDDDFRWKIPALFGPRNAGERITIDVVVAPAEGMLFGRLLDTEGKPLPGLRPSFLINTSAGRLEGEDVTTDKDGRFHLPYQVRDHHRAPYRLEIRRNNMRPVAGLAVGLTGLPKAHVTDLGDLTLDAFGVIATGTVVDDRGQPIPGASVQLQRERDLGGDKPRRAYVDEAFVVTRSDDEGRYELFGELEPGRYRLHGQARNHFPYQSPDLGANKQIDLQLLRNSKVVGTVLTPDFLAGHRMRVILQSAFDSKQRREDQIHDHNGKRYIYLDWVRPGIYSLSIRVRGFPDPVIRIDGIEIQPGQQGPHPRLTNVDLRALLHRFEISAVDENNRRIQPDWPLIAKIVRPDGQTSFVGFPWKGKGGVLEIISGSPQLEVWPRANGYRAELPSSVLGPGASVLRFLKIPPIELQLPGMRGLVGQAMVWIKLQSTGNQSGPRALTTWDGPSNRIGRWYGGLKRREAGILLGPGDSVRIPLMDDGKYKVIAYLLATGKQRTGRAVAVALGEVDIRIVPGSGPLKVTVNVPAEPVKQGLTKLAQNEAAAVKR